MTQFNLGFGWANVVGAALALAKMLMGKCIIKKPLQTQLLVIKCQVNTELYKPQCATALSLAHTVYLSLSLSVPSVLSPAELTKIVENLVWQMHE